MPSLERRQEPEPGKTSFNSIFEEELGSIDKEIKEVEAWTTEIMLGSTIRRRDQELRSLLRTRTAIERIRGRLVTELGKDIEKDGRK